MLEERELYDTELLATGVMDSVSGFMCDKDHDSVALSGRTASGRVMAFPILLEIPESVKLDAGAFCVQLFDLYSNPIAKVEIECVFRSLLLSQEGATVSSESQSEARRFVGGRIFDFQGIKNRPLDSFRLSPREVQAEIFIRGSPLVIAILVQSILFEADVHSIHKILASTNSLVIIHIPVNSGSDEFIPYTIRMRCIQAAINNSILSLYTQRIRLVLIPLFVRGSGARHHVMYMQIAKLYGASDVVFLDLHETRMDNLSIFSAEVKINILLAFEERFEPSSLRESISSGQRADPSILNARAVDIIYQYYPALSKRGLVVMFVGLSGSGKSTLASLLKEKLEYHPYNKLVTHIDGDVMRATISQDLSHSPEDRIIHMKRMERIASAVAYHRGVVAVSTMGSQRDLRLRFREAVKLGGAANFFLVYVNTSLQRCAARDTKGLYRKAREGLINSLVGFSREFEEPDINEYDISISTEIPAPESIELVVRDLMSLGYVKMNSM